MTSYATFLRSLLTLLLVLSGVSASQAGLFGRWRARRDYQTSPPAAVSTPPVTSLPAAAQPTTSTAGPTVYMVAKPVIGANAVSPTASVPAASYAPAPRVYSGTGWSVLPRSTSDFGKFPPYSN